MVQKTKKSKRCRPLKLSIDARELTFASPGDFAFAVAARNCVPLQRLDGAMQQDADNLWREAEEIKKVEKQLIAILEENACGKTTCAAALEQLSLKLFSNDHDWRKIFAVLSRLGPAFDDFQRVGLSKYLQYLGARQETLRLVFVIKHNRSEPQQGSPVDMEGEADTKETMIFDIEQSAAARREVNALTRLPQGEATRICLKPGQSIDLLLGKHAFSLTRAQEWVLTDPLGNCFPVRPGRNTVGRGRNNDIALASDFRHLSRRHLIIEPAGGSTILLTDLSAHGTFVLTLDIDA